MDCAVLTMTFVAIRSCLCGDLTQRECRAGGGSHQDENLGLTPSAPAPQQTCPRPRPPRHQQLAQQATTWHGSGDRSSETQAPAGLAPSEASLLDAQTATSPS